MPLKIEIDVKGVIKAEKTITRSFDNIKEEAKSITTSLEKIQKGVSTIGKGAPKTKSLSDAFMVLNTNIGKLNRGMISAESFQLKYGKAISSVKKKIRDSYGENTKALLVYNRVTTALENYKEKAKRVVEETKRLKTEQRQLNKSMTSNFFTSGGKALKKIADNTKLAEKAQKKYNRSVVSNELKRGATSLKRINREAKKLKTSQDKLNRSITSNAFKSGARDLKVMRKAQEKLNKEVKKGNGVFDGLTKRITAGALAAKGIERVADFIIGQTIALKQYSDEWIKITNIIKLGVNTEGELIKSRQRILDISQETRTDLLAQTTLYNRLTLSQKELGVSQEEIISVIRGVGHALGVTATSALESRGSLIQLAQAFGQPIVRAEEFNSILEGTPRIAKAVADGFGLTRSQLRKLVLEGKVTNKQFFQAFQSQLPLLAQQFSEVSPTIDQSLVVIKNGMRAVVGQFNELTGIAPAVASAFVEIGKGLSGVATTIAAITKLTSKKPLGEQLLDVRERINRITDPEKFKRERAQRLKEKKLRLKDRLAERKEILEENRRLATQGFIDKRDPIGGRGIVVGRITKEQKALQSALAEESEIAGKLLIQQREITFKALKAISDTERRLVVDAEQAKFEAIDKAFKSTGIISAEGKQLLIQKLKEEKELFIKATGDRVTAEKVYQTKIGVIRNKIFQQESARITALQKQNRLKFATEIKFATQIKDLNIDRLESIRKKQKDVDQEIIKNAKIKNALALKLVLAQAKATKNTEILRIQQRREGLERAETAATQTPGTAFEQWVKGLNKTRDAMTLTEDAIVLGFDAMGSALSEFVNTGKLDFREFARSIIADMAKIAAQKVLMGIVSSVVGGISGAFGGGGFTVGKAPSGFATGGDFMVGGSGGTDSQLVQFMATPNERVTVQTPQQQQSTAPAPVSAAAPIINLKNVNVLDPSIVQDYLESSEGERVFMNTIQRNTGPIKNMLSDR